MASTTIFLLVVAGMSTAVPALSASSRLQQQKHKEHQVLARLAAFGASAGRSTGSRSEGHRLRRSAAASSLARVGDGDWDCFCAVAQMNYKCHKSPKGSDEGPDIADAVIFLKDPHNTWVKKESPTRQSINTSNQAAGESKKTSEAKDDSGVAARVLTSSTTPRPAKTRMDFIGPFACDTEEIEDGCTNVMRESSKPTGFKTKVQCVHWCPKICTVKRLGREQADHAATNFGRLLYGPDKHARRGHNPPDVGAFAGGGHFRDQAWQEHRQEHLMRNLFTKLGLAIPDGEVCSWKVHKAAQVHLPCLKPFQQ